MPRLSRDLIRSGAPTIADPLPERVLQFGEGNFLRAFVDWMFERLNAGGTFQGRVVVIQPIERGQGDVLNAQDGLYTVILRGMENGHVHEERQLVESVSRAINPYQNAEAWLETARGPDFRFVVSNTTEAGIRLHPDDALDAVPCPSFPGKLTQWLYARYRHFAGDVERGVVIFPCELIERNGYELHELVVKLAHSWGLPPDFLAWLEQSCTFTSTLVDRIVTGYPESEAPHLFRELGYEDHLMVAGESYHCWVIESDDDLERELPFRTAGLNVIWTRDAAPYRERKVRILNGAHTAMAVTGLLLGYETVGECMADDKMRSFVERLLHEEINPSLTLPEDDVSSFTRAVLERFENPFIRHELSSIALNSVSKFRARLLGSLVDYLKREDGLPPRLCFALAALIALYKAKNDSVSESQLSFSPKDDPLVLEALSSAWARHEATWASGDFQPVVSEVLAEPLLWQRDLCELDIDLAAKVTEELGEILAGRGPSRLAQLG